MRRLVYICSLLAVVLATSLSSGAASSVGCGYAVDVPGVGRGCRNPDGLIRLGLSDGWYGYTHGLDEARALLYARAGTLKLVRPDCVTTADRFRWQIVYANASDVKSRYTTKVTDLRNMAAAANGSLIQEAQLFNTSIRYRFLCGGGNVIVSNAQLPTTKAATNLLNIIAGVRRAGFVDPLVKYWIYYDDGTDLGHNGGAIIGDARDDRPIAENTNNYGPSYTVNFSVPFAVGGDAVFMHESAHNLGAVSFSAPNTSGSPGPTGNGAHCTDGWDVMCYPDGASLSSFYSTNKCPTRVYFDCNHNDYFNPRPSSTNFLATHWNLASPLNRFFAGCIYATGTLTAPNGGQDSAGPTGSAGQADPLKNVTYRDHSISSSCRGKKYALSGVPVPPSQVTNPLNTATPSNPAFGDVYFVPRFAGQSYHYQTSLLGRVPVPDFNVCFYASTKLLSCATANGQDAGTIPSTATKARIYLNAGANGLYVLNAN